MRYFVIGDDGQKYGPADVATLNSWITEGRLLATTLLENEATGERVAAQALPGLAFAAVGIPTPLNQSGPASIASGERQPTGYVAYPRTGNSANEPQVVPKSFNWGSFMFGWIWGLNHRKPILLLMIPTSIVLGLIPIIGLFINIGIQIWVGYQGNKWAWESGRFNSITQMMECQNIWKKWAIGFFVFSIFFGFLAVLMPVLAAASRAGR